MKKQLTILISFIIFLIIFTGCKGSSTNLSGVIKSDEGEILSDVVIYLGQQSVKSDKNGQFKFKNLQPGKYKLIVNSEGFYPYESEINISKGENNFNVVLKYTTLKRATKRGYLLVGSDVTYPPFEYMENGKPVGFDVDLINLVAKEMGLDRAEIIDTAWDGIFAALKTEKFDIIISSVTITEDRQKEMLFSDPYYDSGQIIAVRKNETRINNENDLVGKVVGVQINTTGDFAAQKIQGIKEIKSMMIYNKHFKILKLEELMQF